MILPEFSFRLVIAFFCSTLASAAPDGSAPRRDPKGRDMDSLKSAMDAQSIAALQREAESRETKRAYAKALRLDEFEGDCVAYDPRVQACVLTVEDFNNLAETWSYSYPDSASSLPPKAELAKTRRDILRQLLEDRFLQSEMDQAPRRDSLTEALRRLVEGNRQTRRREAGEPLLKSLYGRFHQRLFAAREELTTEALASSDSAFADSLQKVLSRDPQERSWRWQTLPAGEVPAATRKLAPGEISRPCKTQYGTLILRLASRRMIPETPYQDAIPILLGLASLPPERLDAINSAVENYYQDHRSLLVSPDTMQFRTWLVPVAKPVPGSHGNGKSRQKDQERIQADTSRIRPILVTQFGFPPSVRKQVAFFLPCRAGDFIGPVKTAYGIWYFRCESVKPGGRPLTLAQTRRDIRKILFGFESMDSVEQGMVMVREKEKEEEQEVVSRYLLDSHIPSDAEAKSLIDSPLGKSLVPMVSQDLSGPGKEKELLDLIKLEEGRRRVDRTREEWMKVLLIRFIDPV